MSITTARVGWVFEAPIEEVGVPSTALHPPPSIHRPRGGCPNGAQTAQGGCPNDVVQTTSRWASQREVANARSKGQVDVGVPTGVRVEVGVPTGAKVGVPTGGRP